MQSAARPHGIRNAIISLQDAGARTGYSAEYLRTLMWRSDNPPPLFKYRGKWVCRVGDLDEWLELRDKRG